MLDFTNTRNNLIAWYGSNKRDLPWRQTSDPYHIWVSEIILQQTRVSQGLDYYNKFIKKFPNVRALAKAKLDDVLKYWQGLGYYSRARNLHLAAKQVVDLYKGVFPSSFEELLKLKGVGKYTAAAIGSISFQLPIPVVDGNVYRVISRLTGNETPIDTAGSYDTYQTIAKKIMGNSNPSEFNQALMELGALVCNVKKPDCEYCPVKRNCIALQKGLINLLPVRAKKINISERHFYYLAITYKQYIMVHKRTKNDIWHSLYDFPCIETSKPYNKSELFSAYWGIPRYKLKDYKIISVSGPVKHKLTHQTIYATFIKIEVKSKNKTLQENCKWISKQKLNQLTVPRLIEKYLETEFDIKK
jgi:A/G-specific adenine glycosylase